MARRTIDEPLRAAPTAARHNESASLAGRLGGDAFPAYDPAGDEAIRPYRRLAVRVLERAFLDLNNAAGSAADRASARSFLANSGMLLLWCEIASLDPSYVARRVQGLAVRISGRPESAGAPAVADDRA